MNGIFVLIFVLILVFIILNATKSVDLLNTTGDAARGIIQVLQGPRQQGSWRV